MGRRGKKEGDLERSIDDYMEEIIRHVRCV